MKSQKRRELFEAYRVFLQTHVQTGVTEGLLRVVCLASLAEIAAGRKAPSPAAFTTTAEAAIRANYGTMADFADQAGVEELLFTENGTWIIPPRMRPQYPAYKTYLLADYDHGNVTGTAAIVFAQNQPIPVFQDGQQIGGFENGDFHGFLTIVDRRTGAVHELHQSFLENSNDPALRPGIVALNWQLAGRQRLKPDQLHAVIKGADTKLDSTGMLGGRDGNRQTGLAAYQCELILDPDKAFNWNAGVKGANFNYVPLAAIEYPLNEQRLETILFDCALASRESAVKEAPGSKIQRNEPGYVPATREAFYPDGTPRYVLARERMVDGELVIIFRNAFPDERAQLAKGAIRVREYDTEVAARHMQVVKPYNHFGSSPRGGFPGADNCFGAVVSVQDNAVGTGVANRSVMQSLGIKSLQEAGIQRMLVAMAAKGIVNGHNAEMIEGALRGEIEVSKLDDALLYDFCGIRSHIPSSDGGLASGGAGEDMKLGGVAGEAIATIAAQRQSVVAARARPPEGQLLLLPTTTTGSILSQLHEKHYGPVSCSRR